jgi:hypothetical protein
MNFHDLKIIVAQIKRSIPCQKCNLTYTDEDIEVIGALGDEQSFFHASCEKCEAESFIHVTLQFDEEGEIYPNFKKLGSAPRKEQITTNEILDMHNFLKIFDGDFNTLFEEKPKKKSS